MKRFTFLILLCSLFTTFLSAAEFDARSAFGTTPGRDIDAALKRAQKDKKRVFVAIYDPSGDYNNQGLQIKYFTDMEETKKLLKAKFIIVLLPRTQKDLTKYTAGMNTERPHYFILSPTGSKLADDTLSANPEDGLRRVKLLVAQP